jgi:hypothetical protein
VLSGKVSCTNDASIVDKLSNTEFWFRMVSLRRDISEERVSNRTKEVLSCGSYSPTYDVYLWVEDS